MGKMPSGGRTGKGFLRFGLERAFESHKNRRGNETIYQYIRNRADFNNLKFEDDDGKHGFTFIMLLVGQIHREVIKAP